MSEKPVEELHDMCKARGFSIPSQISGSKSHLLAALAAQNCVLQRLLASTQTPIDVKHFEMAVHVLLPGKLCEHALSNGNKACSLLSASDCCSRSQSKNPTSGLLVSRAFTATCGPLSYTGSV